MPNIKVESIKRIENAGNLRGFAVVNVGDKVRFNDCRIIQQDGQKPWCSMPSRPYEKDGIRKWSPIVEILDGDLKRQIEAAVLEEFERLPQSSRTAPAEW